MAIKIMFKEVALSQECFIDHQIGRKIFLIKEVINFQLFFKLEEYIRMV